MHFKPALWSVLLAAVAEVVNGQVTVYNQKPLAAQIAATAIQPAGTLAAYDNTVLRPPAPPNPRVPAPVFAVSRRAPPGVSIPHPPGSFWGFSVEMSVITQTSECASWFFFFDEVLTVLLFVVSRKELVS